MDTTVALFFSLGIVMSPTDEPVTSISTDSATAIIAQKTSEPRPKVQNKHELVKKRIAATNAWLAGQRKVRHELAIKQSSPQISLNANIQSCGANWMLS